MDYLKAFIIGGLFCVIGQILIDKTKLTPARILVSYAVIGVLLSAVGVPVNLLGYAYLKSALMLVAAHPEMRRGLTRLLYPQVAQVHSVTPRSVERAIRHAIGQTWARGGGERCRQLMGRYANCIGDRPTNSEFISLLADQLAEPQRGA